LKAVIADNVGGVQRFFDIPCFQQLAGAVGMVGPDAGKAIRLLFKNFDDFNGRKLPHVIDFPQAAVQLLNIFDGLTG